MRDTKKNHFKAKPLLEVTPRIRKVFFLVSATVLTAILKTIIASEVIKIESCACDSFSNKLSSRV